VASVQPDAARTGDQPRSSPVVGAVVATATFVSLLAVPVLAFGLWAYWALGEGHEVDGVVCLALFVAPVVGTAAAVRRRSGTQSERLIFGAVMLLGSWLAALLVLGFVSLALL
jgi:hypothetical protein